MTTRNVALMGTKEFQREAAAGKKPQALLRFGSQADVTIAGDDRTATFVFSDDSVDSYGDTIDARGWDLSTFSTNPVALYGHDASKPEYVVGRAKNVRIEGRRLVGDIEFADAETNPTADCVCRLVKGGFLNTVSVGFRPVEWSLTKDKARPGGIDFKKQVLMEISIVPLPANSNALVQARAAGIDVDRLELLAAATREAPKVTKRGLYSVSALAGILCDLGWLQDGVEWEAEYEGDGSGIPQRLLDAMNMLGQILVDMTIEEVAELLADDSDDGGMVEVISLASPTEAQKAFIALAGAAMKSKRRILPVDTEIVDNSLDALMSRAGRTLSSANETKLRDAYAGMSGACETIKTMLDALDASDDTETAAAPLDTARAERLRELELLAVPRH